MKYALFTLTFILTAMLLTAEELNVNWNFTDQANLPTGWVQHNWDGFKPFAKLKVVPGMKNGEKALRIYDNNSARSGACIRTKKRYPAQAGDKIIVSFNCRGTGTGRVGLYGYSAKGEWNRYTPDKKFPLEENWKHHQIKITVKNGKQLATGKVNITLVLEKKSAGMFSDVKVDIEKGHYQGVITFPKKWTIFLPANKDYVPTPTQLEQIPTNLDGIKPRIVTLNSNQLDFAPLFKGQKIGNCAWAFAKFESPFEQECTLGAGADWWMQYFVNGKKIIDTTKTGNTKFPYKINNHLANVKLVKGVNIIAVKFISGKKSSILKLGGPQELYNLIGSKRLKIKTITNIDDFETAKSRTGNPKLIKGYPTPGTLILTGQGVYKTNNELKISFPEVKSPLPPKDSKEYFSTGIRLQSFGKKSRKESSCRFEIAALDNKNKLCFQIDHTPEKEILTGKVIEQRGTKEVVLQTLEFPYALLPMDIIIAANQNQYLINLISLSDSSLQSLAGESNILAILGDKIKTELIFKAKNDSSAEIVVDNYFTGIAKNLVKEKIPFKIVRAKTFDPKKEKWKMVFQDEFDGGKINWDKWFLRGTQQNKDLAFIDNKGILHIRADFDKNKKKLKTAALATKKFFSYGYFESRLRFTKQPGWWAAFWINPASRSGNLFVDGVEIDIIEDYYFKPMGKGKNKKIKGLLDHNFHSYVGEVLKSSNYNSKLPGSTDDFYVIGLKWTPFEISYYLNGKLIKSSASHSPYDSVTFDAINHAMNTAPLHAILSGQIMSEGWECDAKEGIFPEDYLVDYVRIYEYPQNENPTIAWSQKPAKTAIPPGQKFTFEVKVKPNSKTQSPINCAYLFDNGFLVDYKTKAPYVFNLAIDKKHYANTAYMKSGRSGDKPKLDSYPHFYRAVVQDKKGQVANTPLAIVIPAKSGNKPYQGKYQTIPGIIKVGRYDEGGLGVAYYDTSRENLTQGNFRNDEGVDCVSEDSIGSVRTGEWTKYSVDITKAGTYNASILYGTDIRDGLQRIKMFLDGREIGEFKLTKHTRSWSCKETARLDGIQLPAGKHVITLLTMGLFNFSSLEFKNIK